MATCPRIRLFSLGLAGAAAGLWPLANAGNAQLITQISPALRAALVVPAPTAATALMAPTMPSAPVLTPTIGPTVGPLAVVDQVHGAVNTGLLQGALPLVLVVPGIALLFKAYSQRKAGGNAAYVNFAVGSWLLIIGGAMLSIGQWTAATVAGIRVGCGGF